MEANDRYLRSLPRVLVMVLALCWVIAGKAVWGESENGNMASLKSSIATFEEQFNDAEGRMRFVTLLSPT